MPQNTWESRRTICRSQRSSSPTSVLGIELGSSGLLPSAFTHRAISLASKLEMANRYPKYMLQGWGWSW